MHRPAVCLQTTSPDVSDIGQDEQYLPICSSPAGAIVWMRETYIERSTRCLGRSVCEAHPTVGALVCTTCATIPSFRLSRVKLTVSGPNPLLTGLESASVCRLTRHSPCLDWRSLRNVSRLSSGR